MLSDDIDTCIEHLASARERGEPLAPEICARIERVLRSCADDARHFEALPLVVEPFALAPNIVPFPPRFRCVTPPAGDAS